jgi:membrane-bound serine protease (ClpP class)
MAQTVRLLLVGLVVLGTSFALGDAQEDDGRILLLEVEGTIGPAVSDFVRRGIERGEETDAEVVILRMDTPGGLDSAMRQIIQKIVSATVPVVTYVAPSGARAASAGTYILYASHVAAMAPATNVGAATPVKVGPGSLPGGQDDTPEATDDQGGKDEDKDKDQESKAAPKGAMERKIVNDAVAYIRGLAQMRGRNAEWAEQAVREAASLSAQDALTREVIDFVAADTQDLVEKLNGFEVEVLGQTRTIRTEGLSVKTLEPDWRSELLSIITDPNVAYILMLLGVYGLFFELSNPGAILPGVAGVISLLLALYAFQVLPVNYAGVGLVLFGIAFMVGEMFMPSFGALGIGGAIAFIIGSLIMMDTELESYSLSIPLVVTFAALSAAFFMIAMRMALRQRKQSIVSGQESIIGNVAEAVESFEREGRVRLQGELWSARTSRPVKQGEHVKVRAIDGLTLSVEPLEEQQ